MKLKRHCLTFLIVMVLLTSFCYVHVNILPEVKANPDANTWHVGASSDDALRRLVPSYWSTGVNDIDAGGYSAVNYRYGSGMRFTSIGIPQGSTIDSAYLNLSCIAVYMGTSVNTRISADDTDNAITFSTEADFDTRYSGRTTARIDWDNIPLWSVDTWYTSPDIKTVIQEIVDREGWASGNAIALFWEDFDDRSGHLEDLRAGKSYDANPENAPKLEVTWTPPAEQENSVELKTPSNEAIETSWSADFVFNATFYQAIHNASLHLQNTTSVPSAISWTTHHWNTSSVENKTDETITYSFSGNGEGNYKWNVEVFNSTHGIYASSNRTLTIDIPPRYQNVDSNSSSIQEDGTILLYGEGYDGIGLDWAWLATNESSNTWKNYTAPSGPRYFTGWTRSGNNPLKGVEGQGWLCSCYSNYGSEDKIYIFIQNDTIDDTIECWSFTRANAENEAQWINEGPVFDASGGDDWDDGHVEPHGIIFETQSMADAREEVGEGEGTQQWRLYYCGSKSGGSPTTDYCIGFLNASESDLTSWTYYSGNPVYPSNATYGFADSKVCIYNNEVWMLLCTYATKHEYFTHSSNGIDNWVNVTDHGNPRYLLVTLVAFSNGIAFFENPTADYSYNAIWTTDGVTIDSYGDNPTLDDGGTGTYDDRLWWGTVVVDKDGNAKINGKYYLYYIGNNGGSVQKLALATTTTITGEGYYDSPFDCSDVADTWAWSNFTWCNTSIPSGNTIQWKIFYNDTYGNVNGTGIHSFTIGEGEPPSNSVELKLPTDASTETQWSVDFVFNATFYQTIQNASLHIENTTTVSTSISWTTHHWNTSSVENKTDETITFSFSGNGEGNYKWNIEVFNSTHGIYASSNRTLTVNIGDGECCFNSGFETGDTSEWDSENGTPDIAGTYALNGSYGMKCDSDQSGCSDCDYVEKTVGDPENYDYWESSFWFQLKHQLNLGDILTIFTVREGVLTVIQLLISSDDGVTQKLWCYTSGGEDIGFAVTVDTWHKITIKSQKNETTTFQLDSEDEVEADSTDRYWQTIRLGCVWRGYDSGLDIDVWFDDFQVDCSELEDEDEDEVGPVGPFGPHDHRVVVKVRLNGAWLKGCNVSVEGGPDNKLKWGLTNFWGTVTFKLKTGSYELVASFEQYSKTKPIHVTTHMTIGIEFTTEDIIRPEDWFPKDVEGFLAWVKLPELDLTTETMWVFILPLIALLVYAVKKASEGPKRKWKYSYLK